MCCFVHLSCRSGLEHTQKWPSTPDPPASISWVLGFQVCTTVPSLWNAGMELRDVSMLGKHSTDWTMPKALKYWFFFLGAFCLELGNPRKWYKHVWWCIKSLFPHLFLTATNWIMTLGHKIFYHNGLMLSKTELIIFLTWIWLQKGIWKGHV